MTELLTRAAVTDRLDSADAPDGDLLPPRTGSGSEQPLTRTRAGRRRLRADALLRALRRPGVVVSVLIVLAVLIAAFAPGVVSPGDPLVGVPHDKLQPPSVAHLFGTDELGRDVFGRVVHGAALSLKATLIAVGVALVFGGAIGLLAGFLGGRIDQLLMRVVDVLLAIPGLLLSLAFVTALGYGTVEVAVAVGITSIASFARVTRSEVLRVRTAVYVESAYASGARWHQVLRWHVLPNSLGPTLVLATLELGSAILAVSSLSYLGYGAQPPQPEWGALISSGRNYLATAWWLTTLPGLVIVALVLATNRISRALGAEQGR